MPEGVFVTHVAAGAVDTKVWNQRPEIARDKMLSPDAVADAVVAVLGTPVQELVLRPPSGIL
jgi:short-subunit dehydrogenase